MALDLLSLGDGEGAAGSADKVKERLLTASILQSKTSLWRHKVKSQYNKCSAINLHKFEFERTHTWSSMALLAVGLTCCHIRSTEQS